VRTALRAAACLVLATGLSTAALAQEPAPQAPPAPAPSAPLSPTPINSPGWQLDATGLVYSEQSRTTVAEPIGRLTRFFQNGQTLSAQLAIDAMTGATPTGARPSTTTQTVTSPSGSTTHTVGEVPTHQYHDLRKAAEMDWGFPVGTLFQGGANAHYSREHDYSSIGAGGSASLDLLHRLVTVTVGGGYNKDEVFPVGGTPIPLVDASTERAPGNNAKDVGSWLVGLSRVLTRRWLVGGNLTLTREKGYLTEPYKVISLVDPATDVSQVQLNEGRPTTRDRRAALASAVYHQDANILYLEYRYYWDDWRVTSHTVDGRYLISLPGGAHVTPHLRLYTQQAADFYAPKLDLNAPLPEFASSDYRLGPLNGVTAGASYGFRMPNSPGEWTVRAEYIRQWGRGPAFPTGSGDGGGGQVPDTRARPAAAQATTDPQPIDTIPPLNIGSVVIGYTLHF
jgi:hypothetical protein